METTKRTARPRRARCRGALALAAAAVLAAGALSAAPAAAVQIDWVTVGDPGNAADTEVMNDGTTGYGSVGYRYRISETEVTNAQYAEFLNAVAASDPNGLYNTNMGSASFGGITRSGSSGSFSYSVKAGDAAKPVNFVSVWDSLRFANWLHNGQPTGAQGSGTTEDGAYTITAQGISDRSITRSAGARIFLTSEDEWYKAAYYHALSASYFDYPAGTDTQTACAAPSPTPNTANCDFVAGDLTDVGSYTGSASPAGTFDQGGNVWEWNETVISLNRGARGGSFGGGPSGLAASERVNFGGPHVEGDSVGFRVASPIPEPGTGLLVTGGVLGLAASRRRRA